MRIGIDTRLLERRMTGIGRFLSNMLKELPSVDRKNKYFLFTYKKIENLDTYFKNVFTGDYRINEKLYSPYWTNLILPKYLKHYEIDLYFSVNKILPYKKNEGVKYVSVIHDIFYKLDNSFHPFLYRKYLDLFLSLSIRKSDLIVTVSDNSKKDIISFFNLRESKIRVVYEAADESFCPLTLTESERENLKLKYRLSDKFILYVGVIENRKNIYGILKIADLVLRDKSELKFLLIGRPGYGSEKIIKEINKRENIIYLEYVDDETLKKLYSISRAFLFLSFYEGFGLPPLEAMQAGVPVVVSNSSSLNEVVGSGGILHDPGDFKSIYNDLIKLVDDDYYYLFWRKKGLERAKQFNTKRTAEDLVSIFNSLRN
jgi:glycosyltransferase involved in cell wall biosynthesis